jgi:hypothetical protein
MGSQEVFGIPAVFPGGFQRGYCGPALPVAMELLHPDGGLNPKGDRKGRSVI